MATVTKQVVVCDRDGKEIPEGTQSMHFEITSHKKGRGRKATQEVDLCESCAKDFLGFMVVESNG